MQRVDWMLAQSEEDDAGLDRLDIINILSGLHEHYEVGEIEYVEELDEEWRLQSS